MPSPIAASFEGELLKISIEMSSVVADVQIGVKQQQRFFSTVLSH